MTKMTTDIDSRERLRVSGPVNVATLLGHEAREGAPLALAQADAFIGLHSPTAGIERYVLALDVTLGRRALMDLLYALAPYKAHGPDRFSRVLDNWGIVDRALTSSTSMNLLQQHSRRLKASWHDFVRHRQVFMSVFADVRETVRVLPVLCWEREQAASHDGAAAPALKRSWLLDEDTEIRTAVESMPLRTPGAGGAVLDSLVGLVTVPFFLPELHSRWPAWQPLEKDGKSNYIGPASVPVMALRHRRALLGSALIIKAESHAEAAG
jgi:hypothetical protein